VREKLHKKINLEKNYNYYKDENMQRRAQSAWMYWGNQLCYDGWVLWGWILWEKKRWL